MAKIIIADSDAPNLQYIVYLLDPGQHIIHFYYESKDRMVLSEAIHRGIPLKGPYAVHKHHAHVPSGQEHLHIYCKNNQLFAINRDGTAHDQSHDVRIPAKVADALRQRFPGFIIPSSNLIESAPQDIQVILS